MMKSVAALFGAAALVLTITAAPAAEEDMNSANFIVPGCRAFMDQKPQDDLLRQGLCTGIVRGIAAMGTFMNFSLDLHPLPENDYRRRGLCMDAPDEITLGQELRVVVAYIEARPERMHESFEWLALQALRTAWPCR
jgi:hypothetical protein